jgi:mRNA-degrading endonuclease toxin of MazEF toxin-antitoxin module
VANADNLVTIPKNWLDAPVAPLRREKLAELDRAIKFSLELT